MSATTGFTLTSLEELVNETEFGANFYQQPVMGNDTFAAARQFGQVLTGAKNDSYKLPNMSATATLKDGEDCGFTPTDQTTFTQTTLTMKALTVQGQFCVRELEPYWLAAGLPAGQHYQSLGVLEANILNEVQRQLADKMALFPYYGPTGSDTATFTTSWMDLLEDHNTPTIVAGTTTISNGGTAGTDAQGVFNVVETLAGYYYANRHTAGDANNGNIYCLMSPYAARLYFQNYRTLYGDHNITPALQQLANGNYSTWTHPGTNIMIATQNALGLENQIIMARKQNQVLAFDLESDATRLEMGFDQYREYIWWKVRVKMGTAWRSISGGISSGTPNVLYWGTAS